MAQLAAPRPYDLEETRLTEYKRLALRWQDWNVVKEACANAALAIFDGLPGSDDADRSADHS